MASLNAAEWPRNAALGILRQSVGFGRVPWRNLVRRSADKPVPSPGRSRPNVWRRSSLSSGGPGGRWADEPQLDGPHGGLGAVGHTQLVDDALDIHLYGADADKQALGDRGVRLSLRDQAQDLLLARRQ